MIRTVPRRAWLTILLVILFAAVSGCASPDAQDTGTPAPAAGAPSRLLALLALVPASAASPAEDERWIDLSFADYGALDSARDGVPIIEDWAQFHQYDETGDGSLALWNANRSRLVGGFDEFIDISALYLGGELMPQVVGFDYFAVEASATFGNPPQQGVILSGDFDPEAIRAAHTDRGYTTQEVSGLTMLCGPVGGCEDPLTMDDAPVEHDPETFRPTDANSLAHNANPFGGRLRRQYPLIAVPGLVLSSQSTGVLESMVAAYQDEADSLLDLPEYRAAAEAVSAGEGQLIQVRFLHPGDVMYVPSPRALLGSLMPSGPANQAALQALTERFGLDEPLARWGDLPVYELALLADRQEGAEQLAIMAVVYSSEADAQAGAAALTERLRTFADFRQPDEVFIALPSINATLDEPAVFHSETAGRWVAVAAARYAMPGNEPNEEGQIRISGLLYRYWSEAYQDRALSPLWTAAASPEE